MSYLVAAYAITAVALVGYGLALVRERQRRRGEPASGARGAADVGSRTDRDGG